MYYVGFIDEEGTHWTVLNHFQNIEKAIEHVVQYNMGGRPVGYIAENLTGSRIVADCIFLEKGSVIWSQQAIQNFSKIRNGQSAMIKPIRLNLEPVQ